MEFLFEILFGLFFEVPVEAAMESKRLKTWVKTLIFCIIGGGISVLLAVIAFTPPVIFEAAGVCAIWTVFVIIGAVIGHRKKWKNQE